MLLLERMVRSQVLAGLLQIRTDHFKMPPSSVNTFVGILGCSYLLNGLPAVQASKSTILTIQGIFKVTNHAWNSRPHSVCSSDLSC
jgi:hypothetical protein